MRIKFAVHIATGIVYKSRQVRLTPRNTGDQIMERSNVLRFVVDYPLTHAKKVELHHPDGEPWTQNQFVEAVRATYKEIYDEEEKAAGNPGKIPGMVNRGTSNGPYGIWGHDITDLVLEGAEKLPDGTWDLIVGS